MLIAGRIKSLLKKPYFVLKSSRSLWRLLNRKAIHRFEQQSLVIDETGKSIIENLRSTGIAITSIDALFPNGEFTIEDMRRYIEPLHSSAEIQTKKKFNFMLWDVRGPLDLENPLIAFSLHQTPLGIINSYLGMYSKLTHVSAAINPPIEAGAEAVQSQRWHRDPEEWRLCKIFVYLSDVDETAGPFTYIKKSTRGNRYGSFFPQKPPAGAYPADGAVEALLSSGKIDPQDILPAIGPAGTVIFCDTTGLHKGGYATGKERVMYTASFSAPSYSGKRWYTLPTNSKSISEEARYAISGF